MDERIAEFEGEIAELKKQIEEKDADIASAKDANDGLVSEIAELKKQIEEIKASKGVEAGSVHVTVVKGGEELEISASVLAVYKSNGWKVKA